MQNKIILIDYTSLKKNEKNKQGLDEFVKKAKENEQKIIGLIDFGKVENLNPDLDGYIKFGRNYKKHNEDFVKIIKGITEEVNPNNFIVISSDPEVMLLFKMYNFSTCLINTGINDMIDSKCDYEVGNAKSLKMLYR